MPNGNIQAFDPTAQQKVKPSRDCKSMCAPATTSVDAYAPTAFNVCRTFVMQHLFARNMELTAILINPVAQSSTMMYEQKLYLGNHAWAFSAECIVPCFCLQEAGAAAGCAAACWAAVWAVADDCQLVVLLTIKHQVTEVEKSRLFLNLIIKRKQGSQMITRASFWQRQRPAPSTQRYLSVQDLHLIQSKSDLQAKICRAKDAQEEL